MRLNNTLRKIREKGLLDDKMVSLACSRCRRPRTSSKDYHPPRP